MTLSKLRSEKMSVDSLWRAHKLSNPMIDNFMFGFAKAKEYIAQFLKKVKFYWAEMLRK